MNQRNSQRNDEIRVFIGLDLPDPCKDALEQTITSLQREISDGVRWVRPSGIHLTLKFLGNIPTADTEKVLEAMQLAVREDKTRAFCLELEELGMFPNRREPRVLWAGITGNLIRLESLQSQVEAALEPVGYTRDQRPFRPHLTLGRVRDNVPKSARAKIGQVLAEGRLAASPHWKAQALHLIESDRRPDGAVYTVLGTVPFDEI